MSTAVPPADPVPVAPSPTVDVDDWSTAMQAVLGTELPAGQWPQLLQLARTRLDELAVQVRLEGHCSAAELEMSMISELLTMLTGRADGAVTMQ